MRSSVDNGEAGAAGLSPCVSAQRNKKRFPGRWSLRQLIYSSPLSRRRSSGSGGGTSTKVYKKVEHGNTGKDSLDGKLGHTSTSKEDKHSVELLRANSKSSVYASSTKSGDGPGHYWECPLCFAELSPDEFCELNGCGHRACVSCFQQYLRVEITESRICISCPECLEPMHPNEIKAVLNNPHLFEKYEDFMVRRVLAVDPDTRWCPAPDCSFAVIASECASCPKLKCERPGCHSYFCYHCKAEWHPNQTCDAARAQRSPNIRSSSVAYSQDSQCRDDIKPCPRCQVLIVKMDDGSCNHMMCAVCGAEFCWLCMKEINDLHFLSPSGCTFWGKKPWSRKKKILWQLGTLVGAPVGIALVAGITVPAMVIGIPVWVGKKLFARYRTGNKHKRNAAIVGGVIASVMISPLLAGLAVGIGVPILLFYVYGVVPVSLCRGGGCGGFTAEEPPPTPAPDTTSVDATSTKEPANPSIGEASISLASGSHRDADRESASTVALAGSLHQAAHRLEVQADLTSTQRLSLSSLTESVNTSILLDDGGASIRALAGSILSYKPANGSDSCSCMTTEDCTSERVRFDDNVSFIIANQAEKTSIGSSCSFRARCSKSAMGKASPAQDTLSSDSIYIDMDDGKSSRKLSTQASVLRSQFFHSINECKPNANSLDDQTIIEVSNETLDKTAVSLVKETKNIVICQLRPASSTVSLDEKMKLDESSVTNFSNESLNNSTVPLISEPNNVVVRPIKTVSASKYESTEL
ncbi:E3 ubiquitin-protein ligase RNF19A-like [Anthonomus grandis grandis]|uniref:E3 ubiquitin-protein ligase RNF19A-like n=1 Tax=Anthonomus grandis grandis TaxID=2921223 RepID=UPI002165C2B9|nr:E3 ubiquitin-protein ligase RNF19A-like [Anthonomus grandis grandis]XP_050295944.1 E3 ubiquitin-protein ligase RNF19A-like [Anthonomus grandis grandis]XP_050295945.1 E3 ubiquitin-protein ligase RNF19A-like [Anthonomus grandis grandis]XP_050295946.1 E3 ubiquitin-protein ligase RNF19A-like [Anthonomus grandis grandis]